VTAHGRARSVPSGLHDVSSHAAVAAGAVGSALLAGAALGYAPAAGLLPVAMTVGLALLVSGPARIVFVVFGGLLALQSSQSLSAIKVAYLAGVGVALVAALAQRRRADAAAVAQLNPLLRMSGLFFALILVSAVPAFAKGTPPTAWLRDVAPYLLFAAVPILALDVGATTSRTLLVRLFAVAGILASISFMVEWLDRRHFANLHVSRIVLPSGALATALFCYAVSRVLHGSRGRIPWFALSVFLVSIELVTGTRSSLVVLASLPVIALGARRATPKRLRRLLAFVVVFAAAVSISAQVVAKLAGADTGPAVQRLESIFQPGATFTSDASFRERKIQTHRAWADFRSDPVFGAGPGHTFIWLDQFGKRHDSFTIDSPLAFLAKFGLLGLAVLLAAAGSVVVFLRRFAMTSPEASVLRAALMGYAAVWLVFLPLGLPFEDKGFGLGLLFLLALAVAVTRTKQHEAAR
jgi:hypothetical protein